MQYVIITFIELFSQKLYLHYCKYIETMTHLQKDSL